VSFDRSFDNLGFLNAKFFSRSHDEPVWAIGTRRNATPAQAQEAQHRCHGRPLVTVPSNTAGAGPTVWVMQSSLPFGSTNMSKLGPVAGNSRVTSGVSPSHHSFLTNHGRGGGVGRGLASGANLAISTLVVDSPPSTLYPPITKGVPLSKSTAT
jgi:hypothetical protein